MTYELGSLDRALRILTVLAASKGVRLKDLSEALGANQTTVLRTVRVLERHGLVRRPPRTMDYSLGPRLVELGKAAASGLDVVASLRPTAEALSEEFAVTVHIGLLHEDGVTVVDKVDPRELLVRYSSVGTRMPLHCTAAGKAVLALVGPEMMQAVGVRPPLPAYTPNSIIDLDSLAEEVWRTRERRYSIEREEYQIGFACVGTAINVNGEIYALSLSSPRPHDTLLEERGSRLRDSIDEFLQQLPGMATGIPRPSPVNGQVEVPAGDEQSSRPVDEDL